MNAIHWIFIVFQVALALVLLTNWSKLLPSLRKMLLGVMVFTSLLFQLPMGYNTLENMTKVNFCLRCHSMESYGDSLKTDDDEILASVHFQNNYVDQKHACYECHKDYGMFGGIKAKLNGLQHLAVNYLGTVPKELKLYHPYDTKNCLGCHETAKRFREHKKHNLKDSPLKAIISGKKGCLTAGCHDVAHSYAKDAEEEQEDDW